MTENNETGSVTVKKKESVWGIIGLVLSLLSCSKIIGVIAIAFCLIGIFTNKKKKSVCGIIGLVIAVIMIGISTFSTKDTEETNKEEADTKVESVSVTDEPEREEEAEGDDKLSVGETYEKDGLKVTLVDYNDNYTGYSEYEEPKDGFKYIEVSFTYENTDDSEKYVSIYDCDCYADNTLCDQSYLGDDDFINANISKGRNVSFKVYYQVPTDSESIELEYNSNSFWSTDTNVIFKLR